MTFIFMLDWLMADVEIAISHPRLHNYMHAFDIVMTRKNVPDSVYVRSSFCHL